MLILYDSILSLSFKIIIKVLHLKVQILTRELLFLFFELVLQMRSRFQFYIAAIRMHSYLLFLPKTKLLSKVTIRKKMECQYYIEIRSFFYIRKPFFLQIFSNF